MRHYVRRSRRAFEEKINKSDIQSVCSIELNESIGILLQLTHIYHVIFPFQIYFIHLEKEK